MRARGTIVGVLVLLTLAGTARGAAPSLAAGSSTRTGARVPGPVGCSGCWHPALKVSWQWQLQDPPKVRALLDVKMYDVDGFEASRKLVAAMHTRGIKAVCYISAGSWERYRPDAGDFPASVLG